MRERSTASSKPHDEQHSLLQHDGESAVSKLLSPDAEWDRDQLGDVLHWLRQALGLLCGIVWGLIPLVGSVWLLVFMLVSTLLVYTYYAFLLKVDQDEFGGHGALLQEGMFASVTLFLLAWILVYSLVHF
ncbi:hypothetical protein SELMODRAFT_182295 [Selaginella moellendorffii]|uniref:Rab5-interacting protein n=1 Tax=Selaginella moellendorffii TaxID=88036 RepID=D8SSG6_SELML|nr:uncharacterized protein C20orf24 homolog [Selaginella moellendorffii]EFJ10222.1 hypothetical protein SELMODRAFT_159696 [Selaginella moellendorffii]EFJ12566.1 hypothetical protein SELMODRAFT_182295 [Selaginella moellendorffii]|eukprot:XP_002988711.1 uncharacterized protein C20orf24 homolog [Selaginella moellendorffii]